MAFFQFWLGWGEVSWSRSTSPLSDFRWSETKFYFRGGSVANIILNNKYDLVPSLYSEDWPSHFLGYRPIIFINSKHLLLVFRYQVVNIKSTWYMYLSNEDSEFLKRKTNIFLSKDILENDPFQG